MKFICTYDEATQLRDQHLLLEFYTPISFHIRAEGILKP
jgi:hypothetical protein